MARAGVEFPDGEVRRWGRYAGNPTAEQLARFFTLDPEDQQHSSTRRTPATRLGWAVQLGTVRFLGTWPADTTATPHRVVAFVSAQLDVDPAAWADYVGSRARLVHQLEISTDYDYDTFGAGPRHVQFLRWLWDLVCV